MAKKILKKDKEEIFINSWKGRRWLKLHGFLTDSEDLKIRTRLYNYYDKSNLNIPDKKLL